MSVFDAMADALGITDTSIRLISQSSDKEGALDREVLYATKVTSRGVCRVDMSVFSATEFSKGVRDLKR